MEKTGKLIVIEGLDGSGKATQAALLCAHLQQAERAVRKISFPDYAHKSSVLVQMYLAGELGGLDEVNAFAASTFYSVDRYVSYCQDWRRDYLGGAVVVADRYTTSNICHQMVKRPEDAWEDYLAWLADLEYRRMGLPEPDLVLYLDVEPEISRKLLDKRYGGDAARQDLHEADLAYLKRCRGAALYAAGRQGWQVISCCEGGEILPPEQIARTIAETVDAFLRGE